MFQVHSFKKSPYGGFNPEDEVLSCNFRGEPWAVPRNVDFHKRYNTESSSKYMMDLKPLLYTAKALGFLPLMFHHNGNISILFI